MMHNLDCWCEACLAVENPPTCTYVLDVGPWPYTRPNRCGEAATARLTHDGPDVPADKFDEAYTCAWHTPKIGIGAYWNKAEDIKPVRSGS